MGLRKKEYIEQFGEEAWQIELKKRSVRNRTYKERHRKELAEKERARYYANKDSINEKAKEYREKHKEEIRVKRKAYYQKNKEKIKADRKAYYQKNKEKIIEQSKRYHEDNKERIDYRACQLINSYKYSDIYYKREGFSLTKQFIISQIFNSTCVYCGESDWLKLGCDRIDNTKAHTPDNVVCACASCNILRQKKDFKEFLLSQNPEGASDILSSLGL